MKLTEWLMRSRAALDKTPINTTAGESTSLLTQTAGAMFGLMPALMSDAANAVPAQQASRDEGAAHSDAGHAAALGRMDLGHASGSATGLGHAIPAAAVHDGYGGAQAAPHAVQNEHADGVAQGHGSDGAIGSSAAPQPLHLPDSTHDVSHASPSAGNPASDPHMQPDAMHADAGQSLSQTDVLLGAAMDMAEGRAGFPHLGDVAYGASHAIDGALAAIGDTTHATLAALQNDVSQSVSHVADTIERTFSAADHVLGDVTHLAVLGDADEGPLAHSLGTDLVQTVAPLTSAVPHAPSAVDQVAETGAHDAASLLSTASHAALGPAGQIAGHGATGHDAADQASASGLPGSDPASLLHASTIGPHADVPSASVGALTRSLSDIGHAASQTTDGTPLHIPLIGQSYMDHDAGHDAGFSLHALHGI